VSVGVLLVLLVLLAGHFLSGWGQRPPPASRAPRSGAALSGPQVITACGSGGIAPSAGQGRLAALD
jgi:hypothetical protein